MEFNDAVFQYVMALVILFGVLICAFFGIQALIIKTGKGKSLLRPMFRRRKND